MTRGEAIKALLLAIIYGFGGYVGWHLAAAIHALLISATA